MKKTFAFILISLLFLSGCNKNNGQNINESDSQNCGIEQCHGLEISCGSNVPEFCTAIYQLGDFCYQFVNCRVMEGICQMVDTKIFEECKSCASACEQFVGQKAFDCENDCRLKFEK